jgi:outer membrane receptor protein involved in Fe transport
MKHRLIGGTLAVALLTLLPALAHAQNFNNVRFLVVDAVSRMPVTGQVTLVDMNGTKPIKSILTGLMNGSPSMPFNVQKWETIPNALAVTPVVIVTAGTEMVLKSNEKPPIKDIYIKVVATRLRLKATDIATGIKRTNQDISTFVNKASQDTRALTEGQPSVASDSSGQQHVRGEHAEISYVVDGVPLPDTLSGRQGAVVVPSNIENLEMLTGGYAPEFGGQTAAILNITTLPGAAKEKSDFTLQGGSYDTLNSDFTSAGPLGKKANYVLDLGATRTLNAVESQQPDDQTAHNAGSDQSYFVKLRTFPANHDTLTLSMSSNPGTLQLNNRSGLPDSFASVGQGYGFLGLRDANGVRPDVNSSNIDLLGAQPILLPSQQAAGQDINQREITEFSVLTWHHDINPKSASVFSVTFLHSGQDLNNNNPLVDPMNLPVDNSIEYNPTVRRNIHHVQFTGSVDSQMGHHSLKAGILLDDQNGDESYQLIPGSQLSLDALASLDPALAPAGNVKADSSGNPVLDINGNPVYTPTSSVTPVLQVHRAGFYRAAYVQDTWQLTQKFTVNYGLRLDWFRQTLNISPQVVDTAQLSPRANFTYSLNPKTLLRWSFDRLFNTPPLAEGAIVGQAIQPEVLNQYDVGIQRDLGHQQTVRLAYYYKQIQDQVDTGLLIPGSQIGLYSAVNFQYGAVHGLEFSYDIAPKKDVGWDGFVNYSYETAMPNGLDNTGAPAPDFNDHDQRHTVGLGLAYLWKGGATAAMTFDYGSGLASSPLTPTGPRISRHQVGLRLSTGSRFFKGNGGLNLDISNLFNERSVINFQSGFSGTRFEKGREVLFSAFAKF